MYEIYTLKNSVCLRETVLYSFVYLLNLVTDIKYRRVKGAKLVKRKT